MLLALIEWLFISGVGTLLVAILYSFVVVNESRSAAGRNVDLVRNHIGLVFPRVVDAEKRKQLTRVRVLFLTSFALLAPGLVKSVYFS